MSDRIRGAALPLALRESNLRRLADRLTKRHIRIARSDVLPTGFEADPDTGFVRSAHHLWELREAEDGLGGYVLVRKDEERSPDMRREAQITHTDKASDPLDMLVGQRCASLHRGQLQNGMIVKIVPSTGAIVNFADGSSAEIPISQLFQSLGGDQDGLPEDMPEDAPEGEDAPEDVVAINDEVEAFTPEDLEDLVEIFADPMRPDIEPSSKSDAPEEDDSEDEGNVPESDSEPEDESNEESQSFQPDKSEKEASYAKTRWERLSAYIPNLKWYGQQPQEPKLRPRGPNDVSVTGIVPSGPSSPAGASSVEENYRRLWDELPSNRGTSDLPGPKPRKPRRPPIDLETHVQDMPGEPMPPGELLSDETLDQIYGPGRGPPRSPPYMEGGDYVGHPPYEEHVPSGPIDPASTDLSKTNLQRPPSKKRSSILTAVARRLR